MSRWVRKANTKSPVNQFPCKTVIHGRESALGLRGTGLPPFRFWVRRRRTVAVVSLPPTHPALRVCPLVASTRHASRAGGDGPQSWQLSQENWVWVTEISPSVIFLMGRKRVFYITKQTRSRMAAETTGKAIEWLLPEFLPRRRGKVKIKVEEY